MNASEAQILAAMIAAFTAVIITVVQHFSQRRNTRRLEELRNSLEREKFAQGELLKAYLNLVIEGKEQQLLAFRELLQRVQELRDQLKGFLTDPDAYDQMILNEDVSRLAGNVAKAYAEHLLHLNEPDQILSHTIKNMCLDLAHRLANKPVSDHDRNRQHWLDELRTAGDQLAKLQQQLRTHAVSANIALVDSLRTELTK